MLSDPHVQISDIVAVIFTVTMYSSAGAKSSGVVNSAMFNIFDIAILGHNKVMEGREGKIDAMFTANDLRVDYNFMTAARSHNTTGTIPKGDKDGDSDVGF
jgi:hypothetical protein